MRTCSLCIAIVSISAACLSGCANLRPFDATLPTTLNDDEGILVIHVVSNVKIASIKATGGVLAEGVEPGDHVILLAAKEGSYRWDHVDRKVRGWDVRYHLWPDRLNRDEEFTVKRGQLNYPGSLKLHARGRWFYMEIRAYNQSAMMYRELTKRHPELMQTMTLRYAGTDRDEFLERYQAALRSHREGSATEGPVRGAE